MSEWPDGSRNQNIGGTGSPIRDTSASTSTPLDLKAAWAFQFAVERHADPAAHRHAPEPHRPARADAVNFLEGVQGGLPFRNCPRRQRCVVAGDLRAEGLTRRHSLPDVCHEPLVLLGSGPVAMPGRVDGRHREATCRYVAVGAGHQARSLLVLATAMGRQPASGRGICRVLGQA